MPIIYNEKLYVNILHWSIARSNMVTNYQYAEHFSASDYNLTNFLKINIYKTVITNRNKESPFLTTYFGLETQKDL